jgi:hypothetical protein
MIWTGITCEPLVSIPYHNEMPRIKMLSSKARMSIVCSWRLIYLTNINSCVMNIVYTGFNEIGLVNIMCISVWERNEHSWQILLFFVVSAFFSLKRKNKVICTWVCKNKLFFYGGTLNELVKFWERKFQIWCLKTTCILTTSTDFEEHSPGV